MRLPRTAGFFMMTLLVATAFADTRGSVRGRVFDPTGAAIPGATVQLQELVTGALSGGSTEGDGQYEFAFVEVGRYRLIAESPGFRPVQQQIVINSGQRTEVDLRFIEVARVTQEIDATDSSDSVEIRNTSVQTTLTAKEFIRLAGASESVGGLEAYTGTTWRSQEHLHIRGAHQIGYQINGIAIQDLSLFGTITPVIDPRNLKFAEVTSGGLPPEFGNRTAGIVNTITRSGFDRTGRGSIEISGGNLGRESLFANVGGAIAGKFAYYLQGTTLASSRGLNPPPDFLTPTNALDRPETQERHNFRRTWQTFGNFEWQPSQRDSLNLVIGAFRTDFQIPNTVAQQSFGRDYIQFEGDHFENLRWTRVLSANKLLTVSGYRHFNKLETHGRVDDPALPLANDNRQAAYLGGQVELSTQMAHHVFKYGYGTYSTRLDDEFSVLPNPRGTTNSEPFFSGVPVRSWEHSLYFQDQFDATDRFTLNSGGRLDVFSVDYAVAPNSAIHRKYGFLSPRVGVAYKLNDHDTVLFGDAAYLFLPPPLEFFRLTGDAGSFESRFPLGTSFTPVRPEKDIQYDVGLRFKFKGYRIRVSQWLKRQNLFLDHMQLTQLNGTGALINPNIFLPVNLDRGRTHGVEAFAETPRYAGLHMHTNYSMIFAQGFGGVASGFNDGSASTNRYFFLDHDQRHQLYVGAEYEFERWHAFVNANYVFGSGFPDASDGLFGECITAECRLPRHSVANLTVGKQLSRSVDARIEVENLTNRVYPINLGSEFNGSHVSIPRLLTARLTYHF